MAQFMGDIAFLLELGLVAVGLVLIHFGREKSAALLRTAGWILVVGAGATAICTSYFWFKYHAAGEFDHSGVVSQFIESHVDSRGSTETGAIIA